MMITIGRKDIIDLPSINLYGIAAKVDTGAFGCAIHCSKVEKIIEDGNEFLSVVFLDPSFVGFSGNSHEFEDFSMKKVKNSSGIEELRYAIFIEVEIFGKKHTVEFSITDRSNMKRPVLLGRKFLSYRFLVDVSQKDLSFLQKKNKT